MATVAAAAAGSSSSSSSSSSCCCCKAGAFLRGRYPGGLRNFFLYCVLFLAGTVVPCPQRVSRCPSCSASLACFMWCVCSLCCGGLCVRLPGVPLCRYGGPGVLRDSYVNRTGVLRGQCGQLLWLHDCFSLRFAKSFTGITDCYVMLDDGRRTDARRLTNITRCPGVLAG